MKTTSGIEIIKDSEFPVLMKSFDIFNRAKRIVFVNEKWIGIKEDGLNRPVKRYKKDTGRLERSSDDYEKIDAQTALKIWEEWQKNRGVK
jgi:hypothetical protein